jgi:hypothetical protein
MEIEYFCRDLEAMLNRTPGTLRAGMHVLHIAEWDSMQSLTFVMFAQERYKKNVSAVAVAKAATVDELYRLISS